MIDLNLLDEGFFQFLKEYKDENYSDLLLKKTGDILTPEAKKYAALQIRARKLLHGKIDRILENDRFLIPDLLVAEQASNENVASYNASLVYRSDRVVDLTAGLGIDVICFSRNSREVVAVEKDEWRSTMLRYNLKELKINNVEICNGDAETFLESSNETYDVIYLDPSRRDANGGRIYRLEECEPDVVSLFPVLKSRCRRLLIKASPLLDLKETERLISNLQCIHIVEYKRECKEILIEVDFTKNDCTLPEINCVFVRSYDDFEIFQIPPQTLIEKLYLNSHEDIKDGLYIYEPAPSLLKSGKSDIVFKLDESLRKLDTNTNLFCSEKFIMNFPGRIFEVQKRLTHKDYKSLKNGCYNVVARNHPLKADKLIKKYFIKPGGDEYLLAFRACDKPVIIIAKDGRQLS